MVARLQAWARRWPALPLWLLGALLLVSTVARLAWIDEPCRAPCRSPVDHILIFDEDYYVNAARVIDRIQPPKGVPYANSPLGTDPNSEHPPLAKLIMAGGIELFGDGPIAWRLPSVLLGTVAILGMFALVRAAGGGPWLGAGRGGADGGGQPDARAQPDRDARHLRDRGDGLGGGAVRAGPSARRRSDRRRRRVRQGGDAVRPAGVCRARSAAVAPPPGGGDGGAAAAGVVRGRLGGCVHRVALGSRADRAAVRSADRQARVGPPVRRGLAHPHLRVAPDEPTRAAGHRVVSVGLAGRRQADHVSADQPGSPDRAAQPDRACGPLPRDDQPSDPAAR